MSKSFSNFLILTIFTLLGSIIFYCLSSESTDHKNLLTVGISSMYPPFEFNHLDDYDGFDIQLIKQIAKDLDKNVQFRDMNFDMLFPALNQGMIDLAISTITATPEREKNFDFSEPYYLEKMSFLHLKTVELKSVSDLEKKHVGAQLGSTMDIYLKTLAQRVKFEYVAMDSPNALVEAVKAGVLDVILLDEAQVKSFIQVHQGLASELTIDSSYGYAIAFKKGSALRDAVDDLIKKYRTDGTLKNLEDIWLKSPL